MSRTIEAVEFLDKTLFYDINVETVEYHLFDRTINTNKWLRFEDWQQLYEKLKFLLEACTLPDLSELATQTFLIHNNIQVEIDVIPTKCCYQDLFAVKVKSCTPRVIRIKIRQLNLSTLNDKVKALEHICKTQKRSPVKKKLPESDKKVKTELSCEYDPVILKNDSKSEYVPTPPVTSYVPYKPSKFSPSETDIPSLTEHEEPYSPKPVTACTNDFPFEMPVELDSSVEKYSPNTVSTSENTPPTTIPTYKPSTIILTDTSSFEDSTPRLRSQCSSSKLLTQKKQITLSSTEETPEASTKMIEKESRRKTTKSVVENQDTYRRKRKRISSAEPVDDEQEKSRLSQDLFDNSEESNIETEPDEVYKPDERKKKRAHASKNDIQPSKISSSYSSKKSNESNSKKSGSSRSTSRSKRSPTTVHKSDGWLSKESSKSSSSNNSAKDPKKSKSSRSKSKSLLSVSTKALTITKETEETMRKNKEQQEKNIKIFETVSKKLKEMNKPAPNVDKIDLNDIKVEDLIATFDEFKPTLDQHFDKHKSQKIYTVASEPDAIYLLILNIINRNNVILMIDHLQSIYEPESDGVPTYTDLFMNIMLPEWALGIFMKEYKFTRDEAVNHIKMQVEDDVCNQTFTCN